MREFRLDPASGRAMLNGEPFFMRGSNVCIFRFCEDAQRGDNRIELRTRVSRAFTRSEFDVRNHLFFLSFEVRYTKFFAARVT